MLSTLAPLAGLEDIALLLIRIIMGITMVYYGWPKIKNLRQNAKDFKGMGFKPGIFWGTIGAFTEFLGGLAVITGFFMWLALIALAIEMIMGTIWKITKTEKSFTDWSYDLLLLALALALLVIGPGTIAISVL